MAVQQDLLDLFVRGGLEIITPEDGEPDGEGHRSIRTLVMADADIITWVPAGPAGGAADEALWTAHQQRVTGKIRSLRMLRLLLKYGGFVVMFGLFTLFNLVARDLVALLISFLVSVVMGYLIRLGVSAAMRLFIQRQIDKYLRPLFNS